MTETKNENQENKDDIQISAQVTPNPNTLRFAVEQQLVESGSYNFPTEELAKGSAIPEVLFQVEGVQNIMVGTKFVSVTKSQDVDWSALVEPVIDGIRDALTSGNPVVSDEAMVKHESGQDSEAEKKIKKILDEEIRPAVAMDGGDVTFHSYVEGVLTLYLQGACSSCPSATMTLKMGIENRLKEDVPELKDVVQL